MDVNELIETLDKAKLPEDVKSKLLECYLILKGEKNGSNNQECREVFAAAGINEQGLIAEG